MQQRAGTREAHERAIKRVIGDMRAHLDQEISLRDMASTAYMSRYHFIRAFRQVTGVPPRQYLRAMRLQAAKCLLVDTSSSVTNVCLDVGYCSLGTFIRSFTDLFGVSPRRLRILAATRPSALPLKSVQPPANGGGHAELSGRIETPAGFDGVVLVGLFDTAIPQGTPRACTMVRHEQEYRIANLSEGTFYLFALGVPRTASGRELIVCQTALRAGGQRIVIRHGQSSNSCDLVLRGPDVSDPPLLVTVPGLIDFGARAPVTPRTGAAEVHA